MFCVLRLLHWPAVPLFLILLSDLPIPWNSNIEIRSIKNPTVASKYSVERWSHQTLTVNNKLEMIKVSEEGMVNAKIGWRVGVSHQTAEL